MDFRLSLTDMCVQYCQHVRDFTQVSSNQRPVFVIDTNMTRYHYVPEDHEVRVTTGVVKELRYANHDIPLEAIADFRKALSPTIVEPFVSEEDEKLILRATLLSENRKRRRAVPDVGWVDQQQLGHLIHTAREGRHAIAISKDRDIRYTIDSLCTLESTLQPYLHHISMRRYLALRHLNLLSKTNCRAKELILTELDNGYRHPSCAA